MSYYNHSVKQNAVYIIVNKNVHVAVPHITVQKRTSEKVLNGIMEDISTY